jgi:hypothetical protein
MADFSQFSGGNCMGYLLGGMRVKAVMGLLAAVSFFSLSFGLSGCGRSANSIVTNNIEAPVSIGNENLSPIIVGDQVVATKRLAHERAVLGLELLGENGQPISWCTAVLIRPDVILTAGHCFDPNLITGLTAVRVQATTDLNTVSADNVDARMVVKQIFHPQFDSQGVTIDGVRKSAHDHDLALGILDRPMPASIAPQRLVNAGEPLLRGRKLTVYGFGRSVDYNEISRSIMAKRYLTLQKGLITMSSEMVYDRVLSERSSQSSVCQGDSGGPGFSLPTKNAPSPVVVSLNSASLGARLPYFTQQMCRGQSVVQPLAPYREWIDQVLNDLGRGVGR